MSIKVEVESYCHDCPEFDPEDTKLYCDDGVHSITVYCKHQDFCDEIRKQIAKGLEKINDDELDVHQFKD